MRPRHYILIALILLLGVYNLLRLRRGKHVEPSTAVHRAAVPAGPRPDSAAWNAFDHAASVRDATVEEFNVAWASLEHAREGGPSDADLRGCATWLEFYRQGVLHPSRDLSWDNRSTEHLDSCVKYHRDIAS